MMYYVTMTDTFLSGWGPAENKKAKYVYECETYEEALIVHGNAENRSDQKHINICQKKPNYNRKTHVTMWKDKISCENWYVDGFFGEGEV